MQIQATQSDKPVGNRCTAVVVTYQSRETIEGALSALRRCYDAGIADVIVVDNASTDGTKEVLERESSWVEVVHSPGNIGFGRGCNLGLERVKTPYVVFVNPDAELEPGACATLIEFQEAHPEAGMISPAMVRSDGSVQHVGGVVTPRVVLRMAAGLEPCPGKRRLVKSGDGAFRTDWVCGALFLSPTDLLRELGGFDPRFFLYFEETDLCRRVAARGKEIWAVGEAVVHHAGGASSAQTTESRVSGCIADHYFRSRFYYLSKHHGVFAAMAVEVVELVLYSGRAVARMVRGRSPRDLLRRFGWPIMAMPARPREF